ncbi:hypothetical protein NIES4071_01530 [Calothrix sp. NIES-4071]|nr:hypothetical protein NIES4071_01530 [Calothrix sp. NIES-4071]BAZ54499.1 hypothetical protein NIES4105_01520 [Calothrix sp. NIES-4105]
MLQALKIKNIMAPIQLSLLGDGRLVILTPQTVRAAFFQLSKVNPKHNQYTGRHKYPLDRPLHKPFKIWKYKYKRDGRVYRYSEKPYWAKDYEGWEEYIKEKDATLLDVLHRAYLDEEKSYLHQKDILYIEQEINKQIILNNLALVNNEGVLLEGYGICKEVGKNREKVKYIRRYGMIFILESIMRHTVIKAKNLDLFLQDDNFDFHLVRYHGLLLSSKQACVELLFHHRLDLSITWTCTLENFQPRQIFQIKKIYPCQGFQIINKNLYNT